MDPLTFIVLIVFSLLIALGLLIFAPSFLTLHGPLLTLCWLALMSLYVGCAYLWSWLEDVLEARSQAELDAWHRSLDRWRASWEQD